MYHYATVSKALDDLNEMGFTYDFNLHEDDIVKKSKLTIQHIYRYEGDTNPDDETVMASNLLGKKRSICSGGAAPDNGAARVLIDLSIKGRDKQAIFVK
jgi:hypothetical protein